MKHSKRYKKIIIKEPMSSKTIAQLLPDIKKTVLLNLMNL